MESPVSVCHAIPALCQCGNSSRGVPAHKMRRLSGSSYPHSPRNLGVGGTQRHRVATTVCAVSCRAMPLKGASRRPKPLFQMGRVWLSQRGFWRTRSVVLESLSDAGVEGSLQLEGCLESPRVRATIYSGMFTHSVQVIS